MFGHELAVEEGEVAGLEPGDEPGERGLRRIGSAAEHALAEKRSAELHSVKSAGQGIVLPYLDRMRMARAVKRDHRMLELSVDPSFLAIGAGCDHAGEVAVVGDGEPA